MYQLYHTGQYFKCIQYIQQQQQQFGTTSEEQILYGLCLRRIGRVHDSLIPLQLAVDLQPTNVNAYTQYAKSLYLSAQIDECILYITKYLDSQPENSQSSPSFATIYFIYGCCLYQQGKYEESLDPLFKSYELYPNFETKAKIAEVYIQMEQLEEAIEAYFDIIQLSPQNLDVLTKLGTLYYELDQQEKCFEMFSQAVFCTQKQLQSSSSVQTKAPGNFLDSRTRSQPSFTFARLKQHIRAFFGLGCVMQQDEPQAALMKYRAIDHGLADARLWCNLSNVFVELKRPQPAVICAKRAFQLQQNDATRYQLGYCYLLVKDHARAFNVLSIFSGSSDFEPLWLLGVAAGKLQEYKLAYTCLAKAAKESFTAAVAGLQIAVYEKNFEAASKFSKMLKQNEPETLEIKDHAKALVKHVKKQIDQLKQQINDKKESSEIIQNEKNQINEQQLTQQIEKFEEEYEEEVEMESEIQRKTIQTKSVEPPFMDAGDLLNQQVIEQDKLKRRRELQQYNEQIQKNDTSVRYDPTVKDAILQQLNRQENISNQ